MLKQYGTILRYSLVIVDMLIAAVAFFLVFYGDALINHNIYPLSKYGWIGLFFALTWGFCLYKAGMYQSYRFKNMREVLSKVFRASIFVFVLFTCSSFIFKFSFSRELISLFFILTCVLIASQKVVLLFILNQFRRKGFNFRNVLIVGTGPRAQEFVKQLTYHQEFGFKIAGIIDPDESRVGMVIDKYPVIGTLKDMQEILWTNPIDNVFFIIPRSQLNLIEEQLACCETLGVTFSIAMDLFNMEFTYARPECVMGMPMATFESLSQKFYQLICKRIVDIVLSSLALVFLSPILIATAILIKLNDGGPVLFIQERCGLNGRRFKMYKFRSMVQDAESELKKLLIHNQMSGPAFKMDNDPRVTWIGKFIRKFSIDELPQLLNVVRGEMSLVGPRPPLIQEVQSYGLWHRRRLSMRPGLTCLWQVSGRNKIKDFDQWTRLDLKYIDEWSLALDFNILFRTVPVVFSTAGAK